MTSTIETTKGMLKAALLTATALTVPNLSNAEEITLKSADGSINIVGELIELNDDSYVLDTEYGALRIARDEVECIGASCPGNEVADAAVQDAGPVVWDVSLWGKRRAFTEHVEKLAELLDEKSGGDFTLNLSYGGLAPPREGLDGIAAGDFEMTQFCVGYHPEKNPAMTVLELPFLGISSIDQELKVSRIAFQHPAIVAEMNRWNATLLMPTPQPQQNIVGTGQPPVSLADFKGMTIRATGGIGDAVEAMGAVALAIPAPGVQEAMNTGEIRAASFAPHAHMSFGTIENGVWWTTNLDPGTANCPIAASTKALGELSDVHLITLVSSLDEAVEHYVDNYKGATMDAWLPTLRERGIMEITINDEIRSAIDEVVATPVADAWIADQTAAGLPAQELYDLVIDTIAENGS